jgi:hypothetical protein
VRDVFANLYAEISDTDPEGANKVLHALKRCRETLYEQDKENHAPAVMSKPTKKRPVAVQPAKAAAQATDISSTVDCAKTQKKGRKKAQSRS